MTSLRSRIIAALSAVVLLVLSSAIPAYATRELPRWVTGVLVDTAGNPIAGAPVTLTAWPSASQLAQLAVNDDVNTVDVASTTTAADGSFVFHDSYGVEEPLQYLTDGTYVVDLTIESQVGDQVYSYEVSRFLGYLVSASGGDPTPPVEIDDSAVTLSPIGTATAPPPIDPGTQPGGVPPACPWKRIANLGPRWVGVGQGYTTNSTTLSFTYKAGASSSIGVGISVGSGAFKASGTTTVSSTAAITFPSATGVTGRTWRTQFNFARYRRSCNGGTTLTKVQAVGFVGGATYSTLTTPPTTTYCTVFLANSDFVKDDSRATLLSASTGGDIGIQLSASTGYSDATSLKYHFAAGKRLCGKNGYPGDAPGTLVAKI